MVWSADPKQGYLTKEGIGELRSRMTGEIFRDELLQLYQEKDQSYKKVAQAAREATRGLLRELERSACASPELGQQLEALALSLESTKGKKQYEHPFERYNGESVIVFDEFRSSLKITDMLNYLDGYPVTLPCRYTNRQACYNTVYLISNIPLEEQYKNVQFDEPATWKAFLRRIHHVVEYTNEGCNSVTSEEAEEPHQQTFTELTDSDGELPF